MIGHGGPTASRVSYVCCNRNRTRAIWLVLWLVFQAAPVLAQETALRLRVAWGGGEQRWEGTIALDQGRLTEPVPLGVEADEPGSIWLDAGVVRVRQRSPRTYDGVDLEVTAPLEARLTVELAPRDAADKRVRFEFLLRDLLDEQQARELDAAGNRLLVRRSPGDALHVTLENEALVFGPGETLRLNVETRGLGGGSQRLQAEVCEARTRRPVREAVAFEAGTTATPVEVALPETEGVYDVVLSTAARGLSKRLGLNRRVVERVVQVVVIHDEPLSTNDGGVLELKKLVEIDPATNPRWWERLTSFPLLPGMRRGPLGNGDAHSWQHSLGSLIQLGPQGREPNLSWEAYPVPISRPGVPHVLEVEYPSDVPQAWGLASSSRMRPTW